MVTLDHRKTALLIGNSGYHRLANELDQSIENVNKLSDLLTKIGFHVTRESDVEKYDLTELIIKFAKTINDGDLVFLYFSGHACQVNGANYLIPVNDTWIQTERDIIAFGINVDRMLRRIMERNPSYANIFIFDCCRPYAGGCKYGN